MNKCTERVYNGLIKENPTFVLMLGMCPTLAVTTSAINGLGMGLSTTVVLVLSNMLISMLRKVIPDSVRMPAFIVVVASFVTIVQFLLEGFVPSLYDSLGLYIPLIVVNFDGIGMGLGFTFGLTCIAIVREFIGTGAIFGVQILPLADAAAGKGGYVPVTIFILPAGAFLVLAFLVAGMNKLKKRAAQKGKKIAEPQGCGTDCASCGGCGSKVFPTGNEE